MRRNSAGSAKVQSDVATLVRLARVLGLLWAAFVTTFFVVAMPTVNSDALWLVVPAAAVAVAAAVAAAITVPDRPRFGGALLVIAAIAAPTFAAVWVNVIPLLIGSILVVRADVRATASLYRHG